MNSNGFDNDPMMTAETWMLEGREVAIATIVQSSGPTPHPIGSQLVIDERGNSLGTLYGADIDHAVIAEASAVIASGQSKMLDYSAVLHKGLADEYTIRVYLERVG